jgi:amino acid transporter/nucleotide-binding universal stress UspA family protein
MAQAAGGNKRESVALARTLSGFDATMIGVGAMIGAGIFVLTGIAAGVAGPALLLAFLLNAIVTCFTAASYAELGSAFPSAGGGYAWVKEALSPLFGFLSGWIDWFGHTVACSLYALAFGHYAAHLLCRVGLCPAFVGTEVLAITLAVAIILVFAYVNFQGVSETGKVGNMVTLAKRAILGVFVGFGLWSMLQRGGWVSKFQPFFPTGLGGVIMAAGLTTIAFQGYEVISQCGEEIREPKRNLPRAIFASIAVVVLIYIGVAFVALGAVQPVIAGITTWDFLAQYGETAIVEAARQFMPLGAFVLTLAGLMSTMSALNATIYSSSRVSFAMGRDRNLPPLFGQLHARRRTPHWAIFISGALVAFIVVTLPVQSIASAAGIMFLVLFMMVNVTAIRLRHLRPDLDRGFKIPLMPLLPVLGIASQLVLIVYLSRLSPEALYVGGLWIVSGLIFYVAYASHAEPMKEPVKIIHQEIVTTKRYSILIPVADELQARLLGTLAAPIAKDKDGEVFALHVVRVPPQLSITDGRFFLKQGKPIVETVIAEAKSLDVPVNTMIRFGRNISQAIIETARERDSNLILLGWPGGTSSEGRAFGSVIDAVSKSPPCDVAMIRFRKREELETILVPTAGGANSSLALDLAVSQAREYARPNGLQPHVIALYVARGGDPRLVEFGKRTLAREVGHYDYPIEPKVVSTPTILEGILQQAEESNLVVLGATEEGFFEQLLFGALAERVVRDCPKTVMIVKRYQGPVKSWIQRLLLTAEA